MGMTNEFRVFRPTYDAVRDSGDGGRLSPRPTSFDRSRVGLLWNSKVNADVYLRRVQELIAADGADVEFVWRTKPSSSKPMTPEDLEALKDCDSVVNAFGD